ncbi:glycine betaine ABC transporter substrate-binding protein [Aquisalibacillus elongatus]|uniref:Glycine betaine/proline transport system substrate-binding protein n=1 Tax=Aquisalibacillus elongatus TaxID=485577 RepID=A0A3N5B3N8_9BACI|nr:glycine betaine ABC transporter substrate-binding protein [Aquisalibacillus elongatus]RPF50170.1 glycine betaine/proline transport system substrate-binding protein [Aquisalibacillus elongatus]
MFKSTWKKVGLAAGLSLTLITAACGGSGDGSEGDSEESVSEQLGYEITGIESGSGVVNASIDATETYDNLAGWEVTPTSSGAMATALGDAIENEEPIIVTGWTPHWKFAKYDLKYLKDPEGVYGEEEVIKTMVREGLEGDQPEAYQVLDNFNWTVEDMNAVMLDVSDGAEPADAAADWVAENEEKVSEWTDGVEAVDGESLKLVYVEWDSEVASTNVVATVLRDLGYEVEITPVDNSFMWQAVAEGEADGMVAAWLPATHGSQFEEYGDQMVDLGANLEGAKIGAVVPEYMDIDSLEDLEPAE